MKNIKNKKIIAIGVIILIISIILIKITDTYLEKEKTEEKGIINLITQEEKESEEEEKIIIYITGEINQDGVYKLKQGSRIADAIEAAGGTTEEANLKNVNLAYELEDGEKIYIPNINEEEEKITEYSSKQRNCNSRRERKNSKYK